MSKVTDEMVNVFISTAWSHDPVGRLQYRHALQALFDAKLISLPVDEAKVREAAIRECIALIPEKADEVIRGSPFDISWNSIIATLNHALQSLLPTKDLAKELVDQFRDLPTEYGVELDRDRLERFARWLIEREGVNG